MGFSATPSFAAPVGNTKRVSAIARPRTRSGLSLIVDNMATWGSVGDTVESRGRKYRREVHELRSTIT